MKLTKSQKAFLDSPELTPAELLSITNTSTQEGILKLLEEFPLSFLSYWPPRTSYKRSSWYFVGCKSSITSTPIDSTICMGLRDLGEIVPIMDDKEYQAQWAVGIFRPQQYVRKDNERK